MDKYVVDFYNSAYKLVHQMTVYAYSETDARQKASDLYNDKPQLYTAKVTKL